MSYSIDFCSPGKFDLEGVFQNIRNNTNRSKCFFFENSDRFNSESLKPPFFWKAFYLEVLEYQDLCCYNVNFLHKSPLELLISVALDVILIYILQNVTGDVHS